MRVLVSDPLAQDGLELLRAEVIVDVETGLDEDGLAAVIGEYDALVVRSGTQVTERIIEAGSRLQVIGRAGVGVDNINVDAATRRGILVVNAPDGNTLAAAEHTIAMMLSLARHIPQADASLRARKWARKQFVGTEVNGKTLGVIGLGRIGREVASRARGLRMRVVGYDPYMASEPAEQLGIEMVQLDELLAESDFITVHVPLTSDTRDLIGERELGLMKPTARIINCARGGVVNEDELAQALETNRIAGAALDVFVSEPPFDSPLVNSPKVVLTPHLGASTTEAQVAVAVDVVREVLAVLAGEPAKHPVNAPMIPPEMQAQLLPFCELAEKLGRSVSQLMDRRLSQVEVTYAGRLADLNTDPLRALLIKGLLQPATETQITLVNANLIARERGLHVVERKIEEAGHYANLITVRFQDNGAVRKVSGTTVRDEPHIVQIDEYQIDFTLRGHQLLIYHCDRPGLIGSVGQLTGKADVNIAFMAVGRLEPRGTSLMVLTLDEYVPREVRTEIEALPNVYGTRLLEL
ncbi:MAG: phosphoglycerate dehydrogenase [Chloroflexi bacterium]|nr:phosphoglycerate dehydrogenase [Chloroflexota bacterium]